MVDTPAEEETAEETELEEGAQVTVLKWIAQKLVLPEEIDKGSDPKGSKTPWCEAVTVRSWSFGAMKPL